jgi:hypothetical protein
MLTDILEHLDGAEITAQQYRTARRILDRTHPDNNYARLSYEQMAEIVETDSDATVRGHLAALAAVGLITYRRNSAVHVYWHAPQPAEPAAPASPARAESSVVRAESSAARAPEPPAEPEPAAPASPARAESSVVRAESSAARAKSSVVRTASLKAITTGRLAGLDTTASQPAGRGAGKPQPPTPSEPLTDEQQASVAMLTDSAIGLDLVAAERIARRYAKGLVLAHCCRYLRDLAAGKVQGPAVIGHRMGKAYGASILPAAHRTAFWQRHGQQQAADDGGEAERRRRYAPAEYADIIIG